MKTQIRQVLVLIAALSHVVLGQSASSVAPVQRGEFPLYVKVQLDRATKLSSLKPGDAAEGTLARDVYLGNHKVFAAGNHVRLTVDHLEHRRRPANDHWPWVVKFFVPRHENYPSFRGALVSAPDGTETPLQVSLISSSPRIEVHQQVKKQQTRDEDTTLLVGAHPVTGRDGKTTPRRSRAQVPAGPIMSLEAYTETHEHPHDEAAAAGSGWLSSSPVTLPTGTSCRVLFLGSVSASKSRAGDVLQARLLDPVVRDGHMVLPAGSLFEGSVVKATPPRRLSRAGSLSLTFTAVTLPDGGRFPVAASVTEVELNRGSHTRIDAEGRLRGDHPGKAWMLINGGVTAGIAKEADDAAQLVMEEVISAATDASTAGTARIVGTVASGVFMLTRHGRDVVLPSLTEMDISLNRPLTLCCTRAF